MASNYGHSDTVKSILNAGASISEKINDSNTSLNVARQHENHDIVYVLEFMGEIKVS